MENPAFQPLEFARHPLEFAREPQKEMRVDDIERFAWFPRMGERGSVQRIALIIDPVANHVLAVPNIHGLVGPDPLPEIDQWTEPVRGE